MLDESVADEIANSAVVSMAVRGWALLTADAISMHHEIHTGKIGGERCIDASPLYMYRASMPAQAFADFNSRQHRKLKILVARIWGENNFQCLNDDNFKKLADEGYITQYHLQHATAEDLMAIGIKRAVAHAIQQHISGQTCCQRSNLKWSWIES